MDLLDGARTCGWANVITMCYFTELAVGAGGYSGASGSG